MDLLPDLSINAEIEDLVAQDNEADIDNLEDPKIETITKDNSIAEVESVDNMFIGINKEIEKHVEDNEIEGDFVDKEIEELPQIKTTKRGRPKKPATEKQKAHLARIRQKALETRRKNSELKKQAVLDTEKKIKEKKRKVIIKEPEIHNNTIEVKPVENKITEMEENEFQRFLGNMNKFMILQNKHEETQKRKLVEQERLRKEKIDNENKKKNIAVSKPIQIQKPQRQFIPGINAPIIQKNPYDDYFG